MIFLFCLFLTSFFLFSSPGVATTGRSLFRGLREFCSSSACSSRVPFTQLACREPLSYAWRGWPLPCSTIHVLPLLCPLSKFLWQANSPAEIISFSGRTRAYTSVIFVEGAGNVFPPSCPSRNVPCSSRPLFCVPCNTYHIYLHACGIHTRATHTGTHTLSTVDAKQENTHTPTHTTHKPLTRVHFVLGNYR